MKPVTGPLNAVFEVVDLPFQAPPPREELLARLNGKDETKKRNARWLLDALERDGRIRSSYPDPVQIWKFGAGPTLIALGIFSYSIFTTRQHNDSRPSRTSPAAAEKSQIPGTERGGVLLPSESQRGDNAGAGDHDARGRRWERLFGKKHDCSRITPARFAQGDKCFAGNRGSLGKTNSSRKLSPTDV